MDTAHLAASMPYHTKRSNCCLLSLHIQRITLARILRQRLALTSIHFRAQTLQRSNNPPCPPHRKSPSTQIQPICPNPQLRFLIRKPCIPSIWVLGPVHSPLCRTDSSSMCGLRPPASSTLPGSVGVTQDPNPRCLLRPKCSKELPSQHAYVHIHVYVYICMYI